MFLIVVLAAILYGIVGAGKVEVKCGNKYSPNKNTQIGFGEFLEEYDHPWFCDYKIQNMNGTLSHCSAVLISHEYVLTAAHCFDLAEKRQPQNSIQNLTCGARLGKVPLFPIRVTMHEKWSKDKTEDVAVIQVKWVEYSTIIRPVCIMKNEQLVQDISLEVVGSGQTYVNSNPGTAYKAEITLRDAQKCAQLYGSWASNVSNILCAGSFLKTVKNGDSGGPLMVRFEGRYYLVGIVSAAVVNWLATINQAEFPVLFTRIKSFCPFLNQHTNFECLSNTVPITRPNHDCGHVSLSKNGVRAHPWYCRIYDSNGIDFCAATLISLRSALTAAHCIKHESNFTIIGLKIHCGTDLQQKSIITNFVIAKGYQANPIINDFGILEFKRMNFDGYTIPVCLLPKDKPMNHSAFLVKMSHNFFNKEDKFGPRNVTESSVKIFNSPNECFMKNLTGTNNRSKVICTESEGASKGDSGGPLLMVNNERHFIIGIISTGLSLNKTYLNAFTNVQDYLPFIKEITDVETCSSTFNFPLGFLWWFFFFFFFCKFLA